jgi:hypothetical protein
LRFENDEKLIKALIDFAQASDELKISLQFGDYLAKSLSEIRATPEWRGQTDILNINIERLARLLDKEFYSLGEDTCERILGLVSPEADNKAVEKREMPFVIAVKEAVLRLGNIEPLQLVYEIREYAKRNRYYHSSISVL